MHTSTSHSHKADASLFTELKRVWAAAAFKLPLPESLPEMIDFSPMAPGLQHLIELTRRSGNEHARFGFFEKIPLRPETPFILGPITIGDSHSVLTRGDRPRSAPSAPLPPLLIHTHPSRGYASELRQVAHFSPTDVTTLMSSSYIFASIVITDDKVLMLHKLKSTPALDQKELAQRQKEIYQEAKELAKDPADVARIYTKLARIYFRLSLHIGDLDSQLILQKVAV